MSKITSKYQVTLPKAIADRYGIRPGDEISWEPAGDSIRVLPPKSSPDSTDVEARLKLFDLATERQKERQARRPRAEPTDRGWKREDLYHRGRSR